MMLVMNRKLVLGDVMECFFLLIVQFSVYSFQPLLTDTVSVGKAFHNQFQCRELLAWMMTWNIH